MPFHSKDYIAAENFFALPFNMTSTVSITGTVKDSNTRNTIIYYILLVSEIISFLAYLTVGLYFFSIRKTLKKNLSFHPIIIILANNFIQLFYDLSLQVEHLRTGIVRPSTYANCLIWIYIDSITYYVSLLLMAWAAFQRHLIIFHSHLYNSKRHRIFLHYLPIGIIIIYVMCYYFAVDFLYPCVNNFDYSLTMCGFICYMSIPAPSLYSIELIFHQILPTVFIAIFSIALAVRVIISRNRLRQSTNWQKYRKMIIQLISISFIYMIFTTPFSLNPVLQTVGISLPFPDDFNFNVLAYWAYGVCITLPIIICFTLQNLMQKLKTSFICCAATRVGTMGTTVA